MSRKLASRVFLIALLLFGSVAPTFAQEFAFEDDYGGFFGGESDGSYWYYDCYGDPYTFNDEAEFIDYYTNYMGWSLPEPFIVVMLPQAWNKAISTSIVFLQTFAEPVDYVITAYDIYQDPDDLWNYAGFIPFIPGSMKHVGKKIEIPQVNAQNGNEFRDHVADLLQDYLDDMFPDAVVTVRKEVAKTDPRWGTRVMDIDVEIDHVDGSFSNFGIETKFSIHGEDTARSLYPSSHTNSQGWTQAQIDEILMLENDYVVTPVFGGP